MTIYVLTLFPEMITGGLSHSVIGRGIEKGLIDIECINIRDFADNKHAKADDYPYGGGAGMVMLAQPVYGAYQYAKRQAPPGVKTIYLTPQGALFTQQTARVFADEKDLILLCGHYEGIDERVIEEIAPEEISVGDFILTGGELPAMVVIDAVCRLIPGVLGGEESTVSESFTGGFLEYPQYTRPEVWRGRKVPEVLLSGHHKNVDGWRAEQSRLRTERRRPDLIEIKVSGSKTEGSSPK